jgi:hypothetical protein
MRHTALVLLLLLGVSGCPKQPPPPPPDEACLDGVERLFGPQRMAVIAMQPLAGGTIFTPEMLQAVDEVTHAAEEARTAEDLAVRSITTVPLLRRSTVGVEMETIRDGLPVDPAGANRFREMLYSYEFAIGDGVNAAGTRTYMHLPLVDYEGVDLDALVEAMRAAVADRLLVAIDGTPGADADIYREVAGRGPSADAAWVVYTAAEDNGAKTPALLQAVRAFQGAAEGLPGTAGSYGLAEDVMLARRAAHKGDPAAYQLPVKQAAINQLLMMMQLSGQAGAFGERLTEDGRQTLVRIHLPGLDEPVRTRTLHQLQTLASQGLPEGVSASVCFE